MTIRATVRSTVRPTVRATVGGISPVPAIDPATLFALGEAGAWYDPSDLSTLWQDTAGTVPAVVGDPVGRIDDKSGNALHMTQATAAARPTLRQDAGGGYYLEFDGVDDYMESAASLTLQPVWTLIHAGQFSAGADVGNRVYFCISLNGTNLHAMQLRQDVGAARVQSRADTTGGASVVTSLPAGSWLAETNKTVITSLASNAAHTVAIAGGAVAQGTLTGTYGPVASCRLRFGQTAGGALTIPMRRYGAIAVDRALTDGERVGLRTYFNDKMGA